MCWGLDIFDGCLVKGSNTILALAVIVPRRAVRGTGRRTSGEVFSYLLTFYECGKVPH